MEFDIIEVCGIIYCIKNKKDNKIYIGQTLSHSYSPSKDIWLSSGIYSRFARHCESARLNKHHPLYDAIRKDGQDSFEITEIKRVDYDKIKDLDGQEAEQITVYDSLQPNGYNIKGFTPNLSLSKKKILELTQSHPKRSLECVKRRNRNKQKTIAAKIGSTKLQILRKKPVMDIEIIPIKHNGVVSEVRILFKILGETDRYRVNFQSPTIQESCKRALEFAKNVNPTEEIIRIHPTVTSVLNGGPAESYKYQEWLDKVIAFQPTKIVGKSYYHKGSKGYLYILFFRGKKGEIKKTFGGKTPLNETIKIAEDFISRIPYREQIEIDMS